MGNQYFEPGQQRAEKVQALFERIASRYDLLNDLQSFGLHRYWKRRVLQMAEVRTGQIGLDLCCGTGDLVIAFARRGARAVGVDFSNRMLKVALKRRNELVLTEPSGCAKPGEAQFAVGEAISFVRADAQCVPLQDASFDVVTVGYGLRNLADWERGLTEMCRVARPGARLIVLDFGKPKNPVWRAIYFGYLRLFVPLLGLLFSGSASAYAYILESLKHYPAQQGVRAKMTDLGLDNIQVIDLLGGAMSINYAEKPSRPAG